ncbi:MAG: hypothetical protein CHACPFDD_01565 [Phycisphaerae bacterium]|nr:hypothetical protein [Phycisphaerae bacterium]
MTSKPTRPDAYRRLAASARFVPGLPGSPIDVEEVQRMKKPAASMAQEIAQAARLFEQRRTGHGPQSVTVVLRDDVVVITLHGALSQAERKLAKDPDGAAQLQEFHRQLFASTSASLRSEVERICGVKVGESGAEIEPGTGTVLKVFTTGTIVQVFLLADRVEADAWADGGRAAGPRRTG